MRAKMTVESVTPGKDVETLKLRAVGKNAYPADGSDEDNTYARYTPLADLEIVIANPDLHRKFAVGNMFYVDFTPAK